MRETSNFNRLKETLLEHSVNTTSWSTAKKEWELEYCYLEEDNCICGHDIMNVFLIESILFLMEMNVF